VLFLTWTCAWAAEDEVSPPACSDGVCVVNVFAATLITAPCIDESVLVAYSQGNGATLIQCSDPSDPEENKAFVYDRKAASASSFLLSGGRFIRPDYLATAVTEGIPDKLGAVPLCAVKDRRPAAPGDLLLAEKQPNDSQEAPYCFRIHYVVAEKGMVQVVGDDGHELPALPSSEAASWTKLRDSLAPHIAKNNSVPSSTAHSASVRSDKARLFQSPSLDSRTKGYLVKGDEVEITDDSRLNTGWCRVRYAPATGKAIEAWMQSSDLDRSRN
jgi:hypothetical protein